MKTRIALALMLLAAFAAGIFLGPSLRDSGDSASGPDGSTPAEREILYWVAPMDPNFRRDKPGKSPMGMDLVPVYADEAEQSEGVSIDPAVVNNLGVRTAAAGFRPLWRKIEATGYVGFDETRISHINVRVQGWIVRLPVSAEGERVARGELLFELYSPELVNAQKEYLQALQRGDARLLRGAEEKLRALGLIPADIEALAKRGAASENVRIVAPRNGIVTSLSVREGMYVQPNTTIMSLADLSSVWLQAEVFESQAEWVAPGQAAEARLAYLPGRVFSGQVDYVYPILDPKTRTLRVRLRFDNAEEQLKPNMYAQVSIFGKLRPNALSIPREALIRAPGRDRVVISLGEGRFHVHEVMTGMESGDWVEILAGIGEGDEVVTSAQFLIDSEASLTGSIKRLDARSGENGGRPLENVFGSGRVQAVDASQRRLRIAHGPIEALGWPSMMMEFDVDRGVRLEDVAEGQDLRFALRQEHAGHWVISQLDSRPEMGSVKPEDIGDGGPQEPQAEAAAKPVRYAGQATVKGVDQAARVLNLAHDPIEALGWPAMTMNFDVDESADISALQVGETIHFMMRRVGDGVFVIDEIHRMDAAPGAGEHRHD
jgi:Cu(I)/Ag(I) efflux system membrane fusion protein